MLSIYDGLFVILVLGGRESEFLEESVYLDKLCKWVLVLIERFYLNGKDREWLKKILDFNFWILCEYVYLYKYVFICKDIK